MSEYQSPLDPSRESDERHPDGDVSLPHDLPPVEPPSPGMIVQLFLVPAVIVIVIVGVYALFGRLASQELDWRQLVTDVKSENPHVRWRAALGLAQVLDADAQRGESSQNLTANREIAEALSGLYGELIRVANPKEDEVKQIEFLSKALGRMVVDEAIIPVFRDGMSERRGREVRKHSMIGLAMLAGQVREQGRSLDEPELVAEVIEISRESEPLFRHQSAYLLGIIGSDPALDRLEMLLEDPDQMTRLNAAVSFARNGSLQGMPVFEELLSEAATWEMDPSTVQNQDQESAYFERMLMLSNTLKALQELQSQFDSETRTALAGQLDRLAESTRNALLRTEAKQVMHQLKGTE